jgi:inner membrane protein
MLITVGMISLYTMSVFHKIKLTLLLSCILMAIYGFLFVTLQLADYALLMGSVGLSMILGATMYFTRNINWYNIQKTNP